MNKTGCILAALLFCLPALAHGAPQKDDHTDKEIVLYNWKEYTDRSVLDDFEKQYGIKVILKEFETGDMMISEVQSDPGKYDVMVATDTVLVLKQLRLLAELDLSKIPNSKYIKEKFRTRPVDPENLYSIAGPLWGTSGLVINTDYVPASTDSWAVLWDPRYRGKIALMDEYMDAMIPVLKRSGLSLNTVDPKGLQIAEENARKLRDNEVQFGETLGNLEKVMRGDLWIAQAYSGDVFYKAAGRRNIKYILPKEGFNIYVDTLVISVDSKNKEAAHQLINFLLEPRNAARAAATFSYPPVVEAGAFLEKEFLDNPVIYPPADVLGRGEFYKDIGKAENEYVRIFSMMKQKRKEIVLYNWNNYTDRSLLEEFERKFGIAVVLNEYKTRDMMLSEVQSDPGKYDVIVATDVTVPLLIQYRLLAELDMAKIPNVAYIKNAFRKLPFDPKNKYSVTGALWATTGLVINTNFVPPDSDSWNMLWDKRYKGKIALLGEYREAMTAVLKRSRLSLNTADAGDLKIAQENARLLKENGVRFGDTLQNIEKVKRGELWIAQAYNGDVLSRTRGRKDLVYVLPKEGFSINVDNFVISADSKNKDAAHQLINFFLEPRNAARAAMMFSYPPAVEAEAFIDKQFLNDQAIYPSPEALQRGEIFTDLGPADNRYHEIFNMLKRSEEERKTDE
ncbi:MAG TPA: spermidine/putrescine ABC transporter substrate-binding protein [bacterium]|nr:spermidine/putrescine ABC transporter substrate-binding protein [bacterium]